VAKKQMSPRAKGLVLIAIAGLISGPWHAGLQGQKPPQDPCDRPPAGSAVPEPDDLRSQHGELTVDLRIRNHKEADGSMGYCYTNADGKVSPNLRLNPGDLLILNLKNDLTDPGAAGAPPHHHEHVDTNGDAKENSDPCVSGLMTATSTNLHFHGLTIPPVCHQDDVVKTSIQPGDPPFQYRFRIPANEPPGLYWYHPHIHGFSNVQVLGGASGALIIEGIERAVKEVAGLPERVLIVRDQNLPNPNALPSKPEPSAPGIFIDRDGDAGNNGSGFGKPAKDLSINFVPVPYPDYPLAAIRMKPGERQLWRVLNASAITYLNLEVVFNGVLQPLGLIALDGVPLNQSGKPGDPVNLQAHLGVPPGGRVEFTLKGPPLGVTGLLATTSVDTGPGGESDPNRPIAAITASNDAPEPRSRLGGSPKPLPAPGLPWLGDATPVRTRRLYFSEKPPDPDHPGGATEFYITLEGQKPAAFDPNSNLPSIVAEQGTVEDWIIENRSNELHAFHIHQLHFLLLDYFGQPVTERYLRDTVNVPYYNGKAPEYPSVRIRMDFRDPNTAGTFVYHCHLLEHEDGGMMGLIRVDPAKPAGPLR
jgi:FtsP/CotA-like multicopper oxidase with cupredoxin domain